MKGIDIAKKYYEEFGIPMLENEFIDVKNRIAVGLVGEGSECFGYDDELSTDHDFEPGFCLFITKKDEETFGFKLERAYAKLPKEFMGFKRHTLSPADGVRHGVIIIEDFYQRFLGASDAPNSVKRWLFTPSYSLAEACNGEIWVDNSKEFSNVRNKLLEFYPEDIRKKKIAGHLILMAQSGQYNYERCIRRNEKGAGQLAIFEFVKNALSVIYLLNKKYEPFYKWVYRGLRDLPILSELEFSLTGLTELGNSKKEASEKIEIIEDIAHMILDELRNQGLSSATCNNFETHAYSVQDKIKDASIRNLNILEGV